MRFAVLSRPVMLQGATATTVIAGVGVTYLRCYFQKLTERYACVQSDDRKTSYSAKCPLAWMGQA
eukprot:4702-Heterococcus_DN1.PRE.11